MGNVLSIAATTEALVSHLTAHLPPAQVAGARVTAVPPDSPAAKLPGPGVNVFLYQVTPNKALRNADLQTRTADGTLLRKPQAALDLHYLLTFYGDESKLEQQRLLGAVTLALHAEPTLDRPLIKSIEKDFLADADLDAQAELVRFTPIAFSLEELSKLWSFLLKIDYVLSAAYIASVVLIETDDALPPPALPVLSAAIGALPFSQPAIARILAQPDPGKPITAAAKIALIGSHLEAVGAAQTQVLIDDAIVAVTSIGPAGIVLTLPAGLAPGPHTVQILQPLLLGTPPVVHAGTGAASDVATFVLVPTIDTADANGGTATITFTPEAKKGQRLYLQVTPASGTGGGRLFDGGTLAQDAASVSIAIPGLAAGDYLARLLIDGAGSPYERDAAGKVTGPLVSI